MLSNPASSTGAIDGAALAGPVGFRARATRRSPTCVPVCDPTDRTDGDGYVPSRSLRTAGEVSREVRLLSAPIGDIGRPAHVSTRSGSV